MMILALLDVSWGSLGPPWGCLGTLLQLSWSALGSSWASLEPPSASLGSLLALKGALGGLWGSFSEDVSVDF